MTSFGCRSIFEYQPCDGPRVETHEWRFGTQTPKERLGFREEVDILKIKAGKCSLDLLLISILRGIREIASLSCFFSIKGKERNGIYSMVILRMLNLFENVI